MASRIDVAVAGGTVWCRVIVKGEVDRQSPALAAEILWFFDGAALRGARAFVGWDLLSAETPVRRDEAAR